jgi:hypothetical protein
MKAGHSIAVDVTLQETLTLPKVDVEVQSLNFKVSKEQPLE